mgnify:CR=1 FL=1
MSGSAIIAPERVNRDIDTFIDSLVGPNAASNAIRNMESFLRGKVRNVASLTAKGGGIRSNFNPRGGPMMTARIGELDEDGEYGDWLALSGAMDLTPEQGPSRWSGAGPFSYDMLGYQGRTGSSGRISSMMGMGGATQGPRNANGDPYGRLLSHPNFRSAQSRMTYSPDYISGRATHGRPLSPNRSQDISNTRAGQMGASMLSRALGAGLGGVNRRLGLGTRMSDFLTNRDPALRQMGQAMARGDGSTKDTWQNAARSMAPDGKNKYYREGEYTEKSRKAGWGTPNQPQLWAAPYVSIYYPAKQARVRE